MNYLKHYIKLMRRRKEHPSSEGENHHVFPQCIFGKNTYTVKLTVREHFIAHKLLYKICESRYGRRHNRTIRMLFALRYMMIDARNNEPRKQTAMILPSKSLEEVRKVHPSMLPEVAAKISKAKKGVKRPDMCGDNNPAKSPESRKKISRAKTGVPRDDMKGKRYFGASEEKAQAGIEKMREKKTGMKINYPKNRKSAPPSEEKVAAISRARSRTKDKFIEMNDEQFEQWISQQNLYAKDGKRKNSNVTRVLAWRNIPLEVYYCD